MRATPCLLLLHGLWTRKTAAANNLFFPNSDLYRLFQQSSTISADGRQLYIDGGEVYNTTYPLSGGDGSYMNLLQSTLIVDLTQSWTNSSIEAHVSYAQKPPNFPFALDQSVWYSESSQAVYAWGGQQYAFYNETKTTWPLGGAQAYNQVIPSSDLPLWQLNVSGVDSGAGVWQVATSPPIDISPAFGSLTASRTDSFWSLGGFQTFDQPDVFWDINQNRTLGLPGLISYDDNSDAWSNLTAASYWVRGVGISASLFGTQGVLIFIGGYTSAQQFTTANEAPLQGQLQDMAQIGIYDIGTARWAFQSASGNPGSIPAGRGHFCAVGVQDGQGHFDIFIHGGIVEDAQVYVLSLPSFRWSVVENSQQTRRRDHTCQVIGNSQMIVIGGFDPYNTTADPWTNGIGIFDMPSLSWASGYNAEATTYTRSSVLSKQLVGYEYPSTWDDPLTQTFFNLSTTNSTPDENSHSSDASKVGAIVGISVALVCVVCAIAMGFFWRRRRQSRKTTMNTNSRGFANHLGPASHHPLFVQASELGETEHELPGYREYWELEAKNVSRIRENNVVSNRRHELQG